MGFTLIELMVVIAIAAILVVLAAPDFSTVVKRYRVRQAVEDMTATLYMARSEGMRRGGLVRIEKISCAEAQKKGSWSCGWLVFHDANNDGALNSSDEVIQRSAKPAGVAIKISTDQDTIAVDRWGNIGSGPGIAGFSFRPAGDESIDLATALCVSGGGRIRTIAAEVNCD